VNISSTQESRTGPNVATVCLSDGFGGLELYALNTFRKLIKLNNRSILILRKNTFLEKKANEMGLPYIGVTKVSRYLPFYSAFKLFLILKRFRIDILHVHWSKDVALAVFTKLFARKSIRLVYTRQMEILGDKHDSYHRFVYENIDLFLTITERLARQASRNLPISKYKIHTLYYGTPTYIPSASKYQISDRYGLDINEEDFLIGMIGRIEHAKGQHLLIEAVAILHQSNIPARALIVGNAQNRQYLDELKKSVDARGLNAHVSFLDFVSNPKDIMNICDVVVLATYEETFGLVLIEAMSAGTAVIGSNSGGVPEIISDGETGLLFEPGNSQDLADSLIKLYKNPTLRQELASNGRKLAENKFDESKHYEKLFGLLQELADNA